MGKRLISRTVEAAECGQSVERTMLRIKECKKALRYAEFLVELNFINYEFRDELVGGIYNNLRNNERELAQIKAMKRRK